MTFKEYKQAMQTFTPLLGGRKWEYCPNDCESKICCRDESTEFVEVHGQVQFGEDYEPMVICEDCYHQIQNKLYDLELKEKLS